MSELHTIGHSNHPVDRFIDLLKTHTISAVGDVRSSPYSRFNPQYNREALREVLKEHHIGYVFLGKELGPRSDDPACYVDGKVQYGSLSRTELFQHGIRRLLTGMKTHRIAVMCAEKDPISCHRMILVCRALRSEPIEIGHILDDGGIESLPASERRLIKTLKMPQLRLFESVDDLIQRAYDVQSDRIAYVKDDKTREEPEEGL